MIPTHTKAPDFELPDQNNTLHKLSDYRGKWVVLYFYPKDNTPGCTKEACEFRDSYQQYLKNDMVILGVSKDSVASHQKFAAKYNLSFPLLADTEKEVIQHYEAVKRITYLIDPEGTIRLAYEKVNPLNHAHQILSDITAL